MYKFYFILIYFLAPISLSAQDNVQSVINGEIAAVDSISLNDFLRVAVDPTKSITIDQILSSDSISFGVLPDELVKENVYWGKLLFENSLDRVKFYFIYVGKNDFIDAFVVENGKVIHTAKSGYLYPDSVKNVPRGSYFIPVQIAPAASQEIYIRVEEKIHRDPEFDLRLYSGREWIYEIMDRHIVDFIFQGVFWILIFYNFFLFASSKIRSYLYYNMYLFCISVSYLFLTDALREHLLKDIPQYTIYFIPSLIAVSATFWNFIRTFINSKKHFAFYDKWITVAVWVNVFVFIVTLIYIHVTKEIYLPTKVVRTSMIINALLSFGLMIRLYGSKNEMVRYFIYGTSTVMILIIIETALWEPSESEAVLTKFGILVEIALFSIGLSQTKKIREKEKRKVLRQQIDQLKINESLAHWQKEELEKIIDSRTQKIKKKNKKLKRAIKRAEQAARVKSDFLSVMSHEIRTPMNAVIGTVHLLLGENPNRDQLEHLKTLKFSSENLLILVNDILDYSKVESGNVMLEHIDFDIRELTKGLGNTHDQIAVMNGVNFNILIDHNIPSMLKGDPARLTQILNNLISNAIKFTPKGEIKLLIHLINKDNGRVKLEFTVEDTGIGISKDKLKMIFNSFTQAHADTTRKYGGTGLGLAITKKLIKLFDSQIFVSSKVKKGSKFYFSLFLEESAHANALAKEENPDIEKEVVGKRALVVDDNEINLMMAKKFLDKWGILSDVVISGKEALTKIFDHDYDIILMDLQMPEMDGYEVTATIRSLENESLRNMPIVAVSADTFDNVKTKIKKVGIDDFLSKPFNPRELLNIVHKYTKGQTETI